jgi:hypothetical protein
MHRISKALLAMLLTAAAAEVAMTPGCGKVPGGSPPTSNGGPLPAASVPILALSADPENVVVSSTTAGSSSLTAQVVDSTSHLPASGVPVSFSVSGGQLSSAVVVSNLNGLANATISVAAGASATTLNITARAHGASDNVAVGVFDLAALSLSAAPGFLQCGPSSAALSVVSALALDSANHPIPDVPVAFAADGGGAIAPLATTGANGVANSSLSAPPGLPSLSIRVTARGAGVTSSLNVPVTGCAQATGTPAPTPGPPGVPAVMQFISANPAQIGVLQSGLPQQSTLTFRVTDAQALPVPNVTVGFFISSLGGETISPSSAVSASDGTIQTVLTSGRRATIVQVTASTGTVLGTSTPVNIVGGLPVQGRISASAQFQNIAGGATVGLIDPVSVLMSDRFSNPVQPGTAVSLQSLGGAVSPASLSNANGIATGALIAEAPTNPLDLNGVPTRGIVTVLATTRGETGFIDSNGNGVFDPGETVIAVPEPFLDLNGDSIREGNEPFIDLNGNQVFDHDQSGGVFSQNVVVFASTRVTFSGATTVAVSPGSGFVIPNAGSQSFALTLADAFVNPLAAGSAYKIVSAPEGTVQGGSGTVPDGQSFGLLVPGLNLFNFTINDSQPGALNPVPITVTVTVTSPSSLTAPGGNGSTTLQINGTMN